MHPSAVDPGCPAEGAAHPGGGATRDRMPQAILAVAVLLAAAQASVPLQQADLWRHLANGRAIASGRWPAPSFLDAPPAAPATAVYLYDLGMYAVHALAGEAGLGAVHAVLAALVPVLVYRAGRRGENGGAAATVALVATVALGPWLLPDSRVCSYLFLALTLLLTGWLTRAAEARAAARRPAALLAGVVVFWANSDGWVVLAPVAVGGRAVGELLIGRRRAAAVLALMVLVVLAATFLSPNLATAWTAVPALFADAALPSPFSLLWYRSGPPVPGIAFATLAAAAAGVLIRRRGEAWALAPLVATLFALAVWRPVTAPWFPIAAAPLVALGLAAQASAPRHRRLVLSVTLAGGIGLVAAAWPGWLQGRAAGRCCWAVEVDGSLRDAIEQVRTWQDRGVLGADARGVTLSSEAAAYARWFGPEAPAGRAPLLREEFETLWAGLLGGGNDWRAVLRRTGIRYLLVANGAEPPDATVVMRLAADPGEWPVLYLRGRTVVFGWRDPDRGAAADPFAPLAVDLERRAFRPSAEDRAPADGPAGWGTRPEGWRAFRDPPPARSEGSDLAAIYLAFFDAQRPRYLRQNSRKWLALTAAGLAGSPVGRAGGPAAGGLAVGIRTAWTQAGWNDFVAREDDGPPALAYLAVRAARHGLTANPADPRGSFLLGEAYLRLAQATRERRWRYQLPPLHRLRQLQAINAFAAAAALRPDSPGAHGRLARLYRDAGSLDLALHHLDGLIRATRARGGDTGGLADEREILARQVHLREREVSGDGNRPALDLAREAAGRGLPALALRTLLASDYSAFGAAGARLQLELELWAGRTGDVRTTLGPELRPALGTLAYLDLLSGLAAATGDYAAADRHLEAIAATLGLAPGGSQPAREQVARDVARAVLEAPTLDSSVARLVQAAVLRQALLERAEQGSGNLIREANATVVRGLIALESGETAAATGCLRSALSLGREAPAAGVEFSGRDAARAALHWLTDPPRSW